MLAEFHNFVPSLEWLVCASRADPNLGADLSESTNAFLSCAAEVRNNGCLFTCSLNLATPSFDECTAWEERPFECPSGEYFARCDGDTECSDGYDERNCDPFAEGYTCTDAMVVPWLSVCDGTENCTDGVDEFRCTPAGSPP